MNILLITRLYPTTTEHYSFEKVNDVLHTFAKNWAASENVHVIRPLVTNINPLKPHKYDRKKIQSGTISLENITLSKVRIIRLPLFEIYFKTKNIINILKRSNFVPNVIVSHLNESIMISTKISKHFNIPLISGIHMSDLDFLKIPIAGDRLYRSLKYSKALACRSYAIKKRLLNKYPEFDNKCFVAVSGINPSIIISPKQLESKISNYSDNKINIITVSYLEKRKKIENTLLVLSNLADKIKFKYTVIGDGEEKEYLENYANELGISKHVFFKGYLPKENTLNEIMKADIMILVSDRETFGMVYLEAMAKGALTIATKDWGVDGIIKDGQNGFLCEVNNNNQLEQTILHIIGLDKSVRRKIITEAVKTVSRLTTDKAAGNYLTEIRRHT